MRQTVNCTWRSTPREASFPYNRRLTGPQISQPPGVYRQISRDFTEHDFETTGSKRAQEEQEICRYTPGGWEICGPSVQNKIIVT